MILCRHQLSAHISRVGPSVRDCEALILDPATTCRSTGKRESRTAPHISHDLLRLENHQPRQRSHGEDLRIEYRVRLRDHQRSLHDEIRRSRRGRCPAQIHPQHRHARLGALNHFGDPQAALQILRERHPDERSAVFASRDHTEPAQIALDQPLDRRNFHCRQTRFIAKGQLHRARTTERCNLLRQLRRRLFPGGRARRRRQTRERSHHNSPAHFHHDSLGRIISCVLHRLTPCKRPPRLPCPTTEAEHPAFS